MLKSYKSYILEHPLEFQRLEKQATTKIYGLAHELQFLKAQPVHTILDAGCGSGSVTRFIAMRDNPKEIVGCDSSPSRIKLAMKSSKTTPAIRFCTEDLAKLSFADNYFDRIICRYVLQHINKPTRDIVYQEFYRILKPGGLLYIIDSDGFITNLFPQTPTIKRMITLVTEAGLFDFNIGRKLPTELVRNQFLKISYFIESLQFSGDQLNVEIELMRERFRNAAPSLELLSDKYEKFCHEYIQLLQDPSSTYFHNRFIVMGTK